MNGVAQRLVLAQRQNDTQKWSIEVGDMVKRHSKVNYIIYCKSFAESLIVLFYQPV